MRTPTIFLGMMLAGIFFATLPVHAETLPTAQSSSDLEQNWFQKNGRISYLIEMLGMRTEALSGNRDGTGTSLNFNHYLSVGARLPKGFSVKATQAVSQFIDEVPESQKKQLQPIDPYFTLSKSGILSSEQYSASLDGYIRYYAPLSRNTHDALNKGTTRDIGRGMVRILFTPTKSFLDGKLTLNGTFFTNIRFNSMSPDERLARSTAEKARNPKAPAPQSYREDMFFIFDPSVVYSISPKVDVYFEWTTGYLRHTTDGKWSSINHPSDGQYISYGVYWNPTKKVSVNPYLLYQASADRQDKGLDKQDIGLLFQYSFM